MATIPAPASTAAAAAAKVGVVGPFPPPRHGVSAVNEAVARRAAELGMDVARFDTAPVSLRRTFYVRTRRMLRVGGVAMRLSLFALRNRGATLYFSMSGEWGLLYEAMMIAFARTLGARVFVHHNSFHYLDRRFWPMSLLSFVAGPRAVHVALSGPMGERLRQLYPTVRETLVISNGLFLEGQAAPSRNPSLRRVGYLANLSAEKGLEQVLETAALCKNRGLPVEFVVAGGFESPSVEARFRPRLESASNVRYLGPVYGADKRLFFEEIDAFVFPTRYKNEAEPLVVLEAMSNGRPVIAYDRGCIPSLLASGGGHVVSRDEPFAPAAIDLITGWISDSAGFCGDQERAVHRFNEICAEGAGGLNEMFARFRLR
jgi:glycosyltransferase involved in cell wall biosynthesis